MLNGHATVAESEAPPEWMASASRDGNRALSTQLLAFPRKLACKLIESVVFYNPLPKSVDFYLRGVFFFEPQQRKVVSEASWWRLSSIRSRPDGQFSNHSSCENSSS